MLEIITVLLSVVPTFPPCLPPSFSSIPHDFSSSLFLLPDLLAIDLRTIAKTSITRNSPLDITGLNEVMLAMKRYQLCYFA